MNKRAIRSNVLDIIASAALCKQKDGLTLNDHTNNFSAICKLGQGIDTMCNEVDVKYRKNICHHLGWNAGLRFLEVCMSNLIRHKVELICAKCIHFQHCRTCLK